MPTFTKPPPAKGTQRRALASLRADSDALEARTMSFSFSSEEPVARWFGNEVLSHATGAADLSRLNSGAAPLLWNHDPDQVIGVVESASIKGGKGVATVRFAQTPQADQILGMVQDGILRNVSFAYEVGDYTEAESDNDGDNDGPTYVATSWKAYEVSFVSIPADSTVGVGRAATNQFTFSGVNMSDEQITMSRRERARSEGALEAEAARVREIEALCKKHKISAGETEAWIRGGFDLATARGLVLERILANPKAPVASFGHQDRELGMGAEAEQFSLTRAIRAASERDWTGAGLERAAIREAAKRAGKEIGPNSIVIPADVLARWATPGMQSRATYQVGTATQGGNLVATNLLDGSFIEVLRNQMVTTKLGATLLPGLTGNVAVPRQSAASTAYWIAESSAITESEATFDQVTLKPKTVGALSKMSRLMLLQSTPAIEMLARMDLIKVLALAIDLAALSGTGTNGQPLGIVNQTGVNSVVGGTNGANISFDTLAQMYSATRLANAPGGDYAFAFNSKIYGYLSSQKASTGQYLWNPAASSPGGASDKPADTVRGYPYAVSNQLRYTLTKGTSAGICSELIFGNWGELLIGEWGSLELVVNPYDSTGFTTGDVSIRAMQTVDVGLRHAASFSVMSDALTPGF